MTHNLLDGRAVTNREVSQPAIESKNNLTEIVDLNEVVKQSLSSFGKELTNLKAIIRYDVLPLINGSAEKINHLFTNIISSIVQYPPALTKLFVYFRSQLENSEVMDLALPEGFSKYTVSVFTNIVADEAWRLKNEMLLGDCAAILKGCGGHFICYTIVNTGCLYALQVPGKSK